MGNDEEPETLGQDGSSAAKTKRVASVADFVDAVCRYAIEDNVMWYRGQRDEAWKIQPSIQRQQGWIAHEQDMLSRFQQLAISRLSRVPTTEWDWVCLAQHHRLPTRLLDWTENPLIGLYFATEPAPAGQTETDAKVFALDATTLNRQSYGREPGVLSLKDDNIALRDYLPSASAMNSGVKLPLAVVAPQYFDRIVAQSGVFTIRHELDAVAFEERAQGALHHWIVPADAKPLIRRELRKLGINDATVYPDPDRIASVISEEFNH